VEGKVTPADAIESLNSLINKYDVLGKNIAAQINKF
jgi:hypothetical protein